jgi:hypothetical protein
MPESRETGASCRVGEVGHFCAISPELPCQNETRHKEPAVMRHLRPRRAAAAIEVSPENAGEAEIVAEQDDGVCDGNKIWLNWSL